MKRDRIACHVPGLMMAAACLTAAWPARATTGVTPAQRAELSKLTADRDRWDAKLGQLDREAAAQLKQGRDASGAYAQQVSARDQLDLAQLKLDLSAARLGVTPTPPPSARALAAGKDSGSQARQALAPGRDRTLRELRRQTRETLAQVRFESFLAAE
jgi:hypothetical protein